jgi:hypothetical protein
VAEGAGLENRYTLTGIVGSNPTLSVSSSRRQVDGDDPISPTEPLTTCPPSTSPLVRLSWG